MAWLSTTDPIEQETRQFWQIEYAPYNDEFIQDHGAVADAQEGERVLRRIIVQEADLEWPGLTWDAAGTQVAAITQGEGSEEYQAARRRRIPGGGGNVYATRRLYDPNGWSVWIREADLPGFSPPAGGGE